MSGYYIVGKSRNQEELDFSDLFKLATDGKINHDTRLIELATGKEILAGDISVLSSAFISKPAGASPVQGGTTKTCPFCAETIQAAAVVCRFCQRDLQKVNAAVSSALPAASGTQTGIKPFTSVSTPSQSTQTTLNAPNKQQNPVAVIFLLLVIAGVLLPVFGIKVSSISGVPVPAAVVQQVITKEKFDQLHDGMSYSEAVNVIGQDGTETSSTSLGGITDKTYSWQNSDGSNMIGMFQDGKMISKAQSGLE